MTTLLDAARALLAAQLRGGPGSSEYDDLRAAVEAEERAERQLRDPEVRETRAIALEQAACAAEAVGAQANPYGKHIAKVIARDIRHLDDEPTLSAPDDPRPAIPDPPEPGPPLPSQAFDFGASPSPVAEVGEVTQEWMAKVMEDYFWGQDYPGPFYPAHVAKIIAARLRSREAAVGRLVAAAEAWRTELPLDERIAAIHELLAAVDEAKCA